MSEAADARSVPGSHSATLWLPLFVTVLCTLGILIGDFLPSAYQEPVGKLSLGILAVNWVVAVGYPIVRRAIMGAIHYQLRDCLMLVTVVSLMLGVYVMLADIGSLSVHLLIIACLAAAIAVIWVRKVADVNSLAAAALRGTQASFLSATPLLGFYAVIQSMLGNSLIGDIHLGGIEYFVFLLVCAFIGHVWPVIAVLAFGVLGGCAGWLLKDRACVHDDDTHP